MAIKRWEEAAKMQDIPPAPSSPLQKLLKEHYELGEQILDAEDAEIDGLDALRAAHAVAAELKPNPDHPSASHLADLLRGGDHQPTDPASDDDDEHQSCI